MDINFKFLPAFLGALALSALFGQRAKAPAPRPPAPPRIASTATAATSAMAVPAESAMAAPPRPARTAGDERRSRFLLVVARQDEPRPASTVAANEKDDW